MVHDNWRKGAPPGRANSWNFKGVLKEWNRNIFGDILYKKRMLRKKQRETDNKLISGWNNDLIALQQHIWKLYEDTLANEEIFWFQNSRAEWLEQKYQIFHAVTTIRRTRNHIYSLQDQAGHQIQDANALIKHAIEYYTGLFECDSDYVPLGVHGLFPNLREEA